MQLNNSTIASHALRRFLQRGLMLLLALALLSGTLSAQTEQETKRTEATRLLLEGVQLYRDGSKDSLEQALQTLQQARLLYQAVNDSSGEATALLGIGKIYDSLGEKQKALDNYALALPLFRMPSDRTGKAATLNNIGEIYHSLGEKQKALDNYALALPLIRAAGNHQGEANTLNNIGAVYRDLGEQQKALDNYDMALPLFRAVGDRRGEANTLSNIGTVYSDIGEKQKALANYALALQMRRAVGDRGGEAITLTNIGTLLGSLGEQQKALDNFQMALPLFRAVGNRRGEVTTLYNVAFIERSQGKLAEARSNLEAAIAIVESLRTNITNQELRLSYFATAQNYYEFYIDLLMHLHKQSPNAGHNSEALQVSERVRARALLETLAEANADIRQGVDPKLVERERALQQQLNARAQEQMKLLNGPHAKEQADAIAKVIEALTTEFQQVETQIRQTSPRYAALTQPQPLTLKEIQSSVLDADSLLLEYSLGKEKSYLWAVTPDSIASYELPAREVIETEASRLYNLLDSRNKNIKDEKDEQRAARVARDDAEAKPSAAKLSQMILGPVAARLKGKRLVVVGDGALQYIPFAALPEPSAVADPAPLVAGHEVVNLPSASTLAVLRRETGARPPAPKTLAVLADPVFSKYDTRITRRSGKTKVGGLNLPTGEGEGRGIGLVAATAAKHVGVTDAELFIPRLPGTRLEADAIVKLVPPTQFKESLDFAASRETAMSPDLGQYRYVHFATHGFLDSQQPELSGIALSMFDERGEPQDGFLRAHEVFNLKLSADVVVLSACQTGLGKEVKGEGLVGLTRGFMYAGSPRVVVSLWSVSDTATAELMVRFYSGMLKENLRPAAALRAAQISLMKEHKWESPYFWAAFTLQGEWR